LDIGAKHWERHSWNSDLMCLLLEGAENYIPIDTIIISQWKIMNEAQTILRQGIIITFAALLVSPGKAKATTSLFFFFFFSTGVWLQGLHLEPLHQLFFVMFFFKIVSHGTICPGWLELHSSRSLPPE
jgi:hypothetical protein